MYNGSACTDVATNVHRIHADGIHAAVALLGTGSTTAAVRLDWLKCSYVHIMDLP